MKQLFIKLTLAFISMLLGLLLLMTTHQTIPLLTGSLLIITGFSYISFKCTKLIGSYKVFEFKHIYEIKDELDNQSWIIKELSYDEITQLKIYDPSIFIDSPILVDDSVYYKGNKQVKVTGWVKARNVEEAKRILHYTTQFE
jgi:hypothetical protein